MVRKYSLTVVSVALASATVLYLAGCSRNPDESLSEKRNNKTTVTKGLSTTASTDTKSEEHGHKPGAHGGIIVEIGRDNYHAEAVFEKGGLLKLFTLGKDEAKIIDVESQTLKAYVKEENASEAVEMELQPVPRTGDKPGRTSQFIGKLPADLVGKQLVVTIPIIVVDSERFRIGFASNVPKHDEGMPIGASPTDEKELYLKPGGIYTDADIKANGNMTASQKFKGLVSKHDMKPKPGEKICPITLTKANPQFAWIVGGKSYQFCCPPCVDEFVAQAKDTETAKEIKGPEHYVKRK